jgi:bacillithiol synthase
LIVLLILPMKISHLSYESFHQFAKTDIDYLTKNSIFSDFIAHNPTELGLKDAIATKQNHRIDRETLVKVLQEQYGVLGQNTISEVQIMSLLDENTFTIITAHQPLLFGGPMYFITKALSIIHLTRKLNLQYPKLHFVPIYYMGAEDHDFDEVNNVNIFNKKLEWQDTTGGPVGMLSLGSLSTTLVQLKEVLGSSPSATDLFEKINDFYSNSKDYSEATRKMIHYFLGEYGLIVIDTNDVRFKKNFIPIIKSEIFDQKSIHLVSETQQKLSQLGYKAQAFPREINFFYMQLGSRERIVEENGMFKVLNKDIAFTKEQMEAEIENYPERFSPNVIMRPLFQEFTFPNIAYVGGGGEVAYWIERKTQFEHFNIPFPVIIRRNSLAWIDNGQMKKLNKFGLTFENLIKDSDSAVKLYLHSNNENTLDLKEEKAAILSIFDAIVTKSKNVEATLEKAMEGEKNKIGQLIDQLESRILRAEKQKEEVNINQITTIVQKLFPNNGMQERFDNFLPFYLKYGKDFFEVLIQNLDPLDYRFVLIEDD